MCAKNIFSCCWPQSSRRQAERMLGHRSRKPAFALHSSCTDFEKAKAKMVNLFQKTQFQKSPKLISMGRIL